MPSVFFSYSHADEGLRDELEKQLSMLKRQGLLETWHDRRIGAGEEIDRLIDDRINRDDVILLLVSPDFLASNYCYDIEMRRALERHSAGDAIVIPVILRPCDWHPAPFGKLNATPPDGKPITKWADRDEAFLEVAKALRGALARLGAKANLSTNSFNNDVTVLHMGAAQPTGPRSSNLRLAKVFTERDKDNFRLETFEYMARFFENSLEELGKRNSGIEGSFRRVDANRFFATVYSNGQAKARCTVFMGGGFGDGICYVNGESTSGNSINESLRVEADEHALFLQSMGMAALYRQNGSEQKLSQEGASELYWGLLVEPLQRG